MEFNSSNLEMFHEGFFPKEFTFRQRTETGRVLQTLIGRLDSIQQTSDQVRFPLGYRLAEVLDTRYNSHLSNGGVLRYFLTNSAPRHFNRQELEQWRRSGGQGE